MKNLWYALVVIFLGALFASRYCGLRANGPSNYDGLLLVLLVAVLLAPLFRVNLFGAALEAHGGEAQKGAKSPEEAAKERERLTEPGDRTPGPPRTRTYSENKILNTLWTFQTNYFPDYSGLWTFRVHANAPSFVDFKAASSRLIAEGLVSETNEGQLFLTPHGFRYCQQHWKAFPREHWFPDEEINPARLREAQKTDPFDPPAPQGGRPREASEPSPKI